MKLLNISGTIEFLGKDIPFEADGDNKTLVLMNLDSDRQKVVLELLEKVSKQLAEGGSDEE